jgi:hypothetical protein
MPEPVPVVMYHSVAPPIRSWAFRYLSLDPAIFEDHLRTLSRAGYTSVFLDQVQAFVAGRASLPPKAVALTFDDGYLDNWVFAFPLLKKYNLKGTIFVSADFIDRRGRLRPTSDQGVSEYAGFLSVPELKAMLASGLVDVQAHCRTHTWHFTGPEIADFHHPGDRYPWLGWNARPERKYLYMEEDQTDFVPLGSPVYAHERSLVARRWAPDPAAERDIARHVAACGGRSFFDRPGWKDELLRRAGPAASAGRHETDPERRARFWDEIGQSKHDLESLLGKKIDFLCWPGGGYDQLAVETARSAGFLAWTLGSAGVTNQRNLPGEDPSWMRRIAAAPWWFYRGRKVCAVDGRFFNLLLDQYKGLPGADLRLKSHKAWKLLLNLAGQATRGTR